MSVFWADQKAEEIATKRRFQYLDKEFDRQEYIVKTSASISGVLHIGRLSDTIRGEAAVRALRDMGKESQLIWVAEDMDPLRRIPEGVPKEFSEYIGCPVSNIPDPWGCHASYAEHHTTDYLKVLYEFLSVEMKTYFMQEEYHKGNFRPYIQAMLNNLEKVIEIQNRYRDHPLGADWIPWTPICKNCGKIITPRAKIKAGMVHYKCEDYRFESSTAKGCGYEGESDPLKSEGKLMWKGEWAAQWARWSIAAEGAGKEYIVPNSAWWINSEIAERILDYPSPTPIFYEHLMIEGHKMSASLGNVVYPRDWLAVAPPQVLRFFYNKKLMKTRNFSWRELPNLYDEYDFHAKLYFGGEKVENEREAEHMKRLYEISQTHKVQAPVPLPFSHAAVVAQIYSDEESIVGSLKRSEHYEDEKHEAIMHRVESAKHWAEKYAPAEGRFSLEIDVEKVKAQLSNEQKTFLKELAVQLKRSRSAEEIHGQLYKLAGEIGIPTKKSFQAVYLAMLGRTHGPKAGTLLASLGTSWATARLKEVVG
ncbi:MAG: lysine--tRNA ligase [Candidatus Hydrothermarchaeales archaeon]